MVEATREEAGIFDDISQLGADLWTKSLSVTGWNFDPKMFSVMLFKRLWSNHRGYAQLYNAHLDLEADIILRSGVEAAICIAANFRLKEEFVLLMRQDAASTLQGQIKMHRDAGNMNLVSEFEATLRDLVSKLPAGKKPARLDWAELAKSGGVQQLYGFHRNLSGASSHVTGLSILRGVVDAKDQDPQDRLTAVGRKIHLMIMASATLQGSLIHAGMVDDHDLVLRAHSLTQKMNRLSVAWPGVD